ncbi:MAG: histidinol-phosphate transaminase [Bacteroidota bacterium]|nr:histidinol-phosphate transaminase [Bacteroidota bacterium]MDP4246001.1 histidinol-phosphate transaminase [Bacteroidota bacterium]MDP4255142.1 histidinol-phosphate transaminase [Bacteroidota bacterium]MDP4260398.1 histidinol-phosphate transaminase [Bacteroidota bacterium]
MSNTLSRRQMLRRGALLAGGLPFAAGLLDQAQAAPNGHLPPSREVTGIADITGTGELMAPAYSEKGIALRAPAELKARLFANENPFGPSERAKTAILNALPTSYQYPFMHIRDLVKMLADHDGLAPENYMMAAGSSCLLSAAALCFSKPGGNIISGDPSYEDLPTRATLVNEKWIKVPVTSEYKLDLDAMEKAIDGNTGLVYICNPNNPTATVLDADKLRAFCERVSKRVTVFVDEAYIDYLDDPAGMSMMSSVKAGQNIIVARTFSKVYGFAGLRVGYVAAQPSMITRLGAYNEGMISLSAPSVMAALASFQDKDYMRGVLEKTTASKSFLYETLKKEGYDYIPSSANFVLFPIKMEGKHFTDEMMKRGVGVRFWKFNNKEWCRVSIGRMDEMEAFAAAFKELS